MISIIMPAFNEGKYIGEAIRSIQSQDFKDFELIIVNDGSNDSTLSVVEEHAQIDSRIKAYNPGKLGKNGAINYGVSKASGDWFSIIAADDLMESNILSIWNKEAKRFNATEKKIVISSRIRMFTKDKKYKKYNGIELPKNKNTAIKSGAAYLASNKVMKEMFPLPIQYPNEDNWMALYFEFLIDEFIEILKVSLNYRIHDNNSLNKNAEFCEFNQKYHSRISIIEPFTERYFSQLDSKSKLMLNQRYLIEDWRFNGRTFKILFMKQVSIKHKIRNIFLSSKYLYYLKISLNRIFLGN